MAYIRYSANINDMGETNNEEYEYFVGWAKDQITDRYPEHCLEIETGLMAATAETDDMDNEEEIIDFCSHLWDSCPWNMD